MEGTLIINMYEQEPFSKKPHELLLQDLAKSPICGVYVLISYPFDHLKRDSAAGLQLSISKSMRCVNAKLRARDIYYIIYIYNIYICIYIHICIYYIYIYMNYIVRWFRRHKFDRLYDISDNLPNFLWAQHIGISHNKPIPASKTWGLVFSLPRCVYVLGYCHP